MKAKYWLAGVAAGLSTGLVVAGIETYLDWRRNPGGVFRDAGGTDWAIVIDTALSWLVPVSAVVTVLAWAVLFVLSRRRRPDAG